MSTEKRYLVVIAGFFGGVVQPGLFGYEEAKALIRLEFPDAIFGGYQEEAGSEYAYVGGYGAAVIRAEDARMGTCLGGPMPYELRLKLRSEGVV